MKGKWIESGSIVGNSKPGEVLSWERGYVAGDAPRGEHAAMSRESSANPFV